MSTFGVTKEAEFKRRFPELFILMERISEAQDEVLAELADLLDGHAPTGGSDTKWEAWAMLRLEDAATAHIYDADEEE